MLGAQAPGNADAFPLLLVIRPGGADCALHTPAREDIAANNSTVAQDSRQ